MKIETVWRVLTVLLKLQHVQASFKEFVKYNFLAQFPEMLIQVWDGNDKVVSLTGFLEILVY